MMKKNIFYTFLFIVLSLVSCDIENVTKRVDVIEEAQLLSLDALGQVSGGGVVQEKSLTVAILVRFSIYIDNVGFLTGGLSDELTFDNKTNAATYPTFDDINKGEITLPNNSSSGPYSSLHRAIEVSDKVLEVIKQLNSDISVANTRLIIDNSLFLSYFYRGYAKMTLASAYSIDETSGDNVFKGGPLEKQEDIYREAIDDIKKSLDYTENESRIKIANTVLARIYLYMGNYLKVVEYIAKGLEDGDTPLEAKYSKTLSVKNGWFGDAGGGRPQWTVDPTFINELKADGELDKRVNYVSYSYNGDVDTTRKMQNKYDSFGASIPAVTWQENELMRAEMIVRGQMNGDAVSVINSLRTKNNVDVLPTGTNVDLVLIEKERKRELAFTGLRLADQRRFGTKSIPGTWRYLPISQDERNANQNIN